MSLDPSRIAAAFRALADAFEDTPAGTAAPVAAVTPAPRGRGRPRTVEAAPVAAPVVAAAPVEADPFAVPAPAPVVPSATLDEVRKALTGLKAATSQDNALAVLKSAGGADNLSDLKPEKYGAVVAAAKAAAALSAEPDDPFAVPAAVTAAPEQEITKEELRALVVETQKRTSADTVQKVVMNYGGKATDGNGGEKANFHALPLEKYAAVAAALKALPTTK